MVATQGQIARLLDGAGRKGEVMRVRLDAAGLAELAANVGYGERASVVFVDEDGDICGRGERCGDPRAAYGDGLSWHVTAGGVLGSKKWAVYPVGNGNGATPQEALLEAVRDLRERAALAERAASMVFFKIKR